MYQQTFPISLLLNINSQLLALPLTIQLKTPPTSDSATTLNVSLTLLLGFLRNLEKASPFLVNLPPVPDGFPYTNHTSVDTKLMLRLLHRPLRNPAVIVVRLTNVSLNLN